MQQRQSVQTELKNIDKSSSTENKETRVKNTETCVSYKNYDWNVKPM